MRLNSAVRPASSSSTPSARDGAALGFVLVAAEQGGHGVRPGFEPVRRATAAGDGGDDFAGLHELAAGDFVIALGGEREKLLDSPRLLVAAADAVGLWRGWRWRHHAGTGAAGGVTRDNVVAVRVGGFGNARLAFLDQHAAVVVHDQAAGGLERGDAAAHNADPRAKSACDMAFIAPSSSLRPTLRVLAVEFFTRDAPCNAVKIETPLIVRHANKDHHRLNSAAPCAEVEALINAR